MKAADESAGEQELGRLMDEVRRSTPLVATRKAGGTETEVVAFSTANGELVIPAFTDLEALVAWDKDAENWASMTGPSLCGLAVERGAQRVAFNPAGPYGGSLSEPDLSLLADSEALAASASTTGTFQLRVKDPDAIRLVVADQAPPAALKHLLRSALGQTSGLASAHLLLARYPERTQWMLMVRLDEDADPQRTIGSLADVLRQRLDPGESVDVIVADDAALDSLSDRQPFWSADNRRPGSV